MLVLAPIALVSFMLGTPQDSASQQDFSVQLQSLQSKKPVEAQWRHLSSDSLAVQVDGAEQSFGLSSLKTIRFPQHGPRRTTGAGQTAGSSGLRIGGDSTAAGPAIENRSSASLVAVLRDGSRIFPSSLSSNSQSIEFVLDETQKISIDIAQVHSVQLQPLTPVQQTQWESILDSRRSADTLVLARTAESLDKIEGVVGEIQPDFVMFEFGGQTLNAPRAKLAGLVYFSPPTTPSAIACTVSDIWGNTWNASAAVAPPGSQRLELLLACGAKVDLPLESVSQLDFSRGSLLHVADMTPIDQGWKGAIELAIPIAGSEQLFGAQSVQLPKDDGPSLKFLGRGWVTYRVPADYSKLLGTVFLGSSGGQFTACRVLVKLEDEVLWEQQLTELSQRMELSVEVRADKRLKLEVIPESSFPVGDVVVFQELRLQK